MKIFSLCFSLLFKCVIINIYLPFAVIWICVLCLVTQSCLTLCDPIDCSPPGFSGRGDSPGKLEQAAMPSSRDSSQPRDRTQVLSAALQADSLLSEPPGKTKKSGVGGLSLLQRFFPTEELNQGVLHCRRILYQLSYDYNTK